LTRSPISSVPSAACRSRWRPGTVEHQAGDTEVARGNASTRLGPACERSVRFLR
jgi:hypothetical protein